MSRRMDREGIYRMKPQGLRNAQQDVENHRDERGWYVPHLAWEGWQEFNQADYALKCVMLFRRIGLPPKAPLYNEDDTLNRAELDRGSTLVRIESDLRSFHFRLARSAACARPALP